MQSVIINKTLDIKRECEWVTHMNHTALSGMFAKSKRKRRKTCGLPNYPFLESCSSEYGYPLLLLDVNAHLEPSPQINRHGRPQCSPRSMIRTKKSFQEFRILMYHLIILDHITLYLSTAGWSYGDRCCVRLIASPSCHLPQSSGRAADCSRAPKGPEDPIQRSCPPPAGTIRVPT